jgi:3-hydroxyacyl-CoA dehydrogenase
VAEDRVVEAADVEAGAERGFGLRTEAADLELADLVGQGLAGPADVSVHLVGDVVEPQGGVGRHEVDCLAA